MSLMETPSSHLNGRGADIVHLPTDRDSGEPQRPPMAVEWAHDIQPREASWLIKGLLPDSGLVSFYGPSRAGKSFLALEWALRLSLGMEVLGAKTRRVGVAYVAAEAANGVRKRVRAWVQENAPDEEFVPFALIGRGVDFSSPESLDVEDLIALLRAEAAVFAEMGEPLGVVFVDTLARATPGLDENSSADMGAALAALERIGEELGVAVCVVHHTGKDAGRGARGHSSFFAALDTAIELTHDEETGVRTLKIAKQKDDEDGRSFAFRLKPVTIGADSDGEPITSCVIEYTDVPPQTKRRDKKQEGAENCVLEALKAVLSTNGQRAPAGVPAPSGTYVAPYAEVRARAYQIGLSMDGETSAAKRTRWNRAVEKLAVDKKLGVWRSDDSEEGWLWLP